ncbi:hypothetical protein BD769DRAFT_1712596 [Suillus cothurnatus]|nr:hypothetical protein BD769DRAFT_1712596 [Suillus cothurnatus]
MLRDGIYKHNRQLAGQVTTSLCLGTISTSTTQVTSRPGHYIMLRDDIYKHNTGEPGHYIMLRDDIYKHNRDESLHSVSIPAPVYYADVSGLPKLPRLHLLLPVVLVVQLPHLRLLLPVVLVVQFLHH